MNCSETKRLIDAYVDNELDLRGALEIEEHVARCPGCGAEEQALRELQASARANLIRYAPSPQFEARLRDVIAMMLTSRDPLIDKVPPAVVTALEGATTSYLPVAMTKLGGFLGQPATRVKVRGALHTMFNRFVDDMRFHERIFAKLMMTEKKFDSVLDAIERDGVEQVVGLLEEPEVREEISKAIHDAILAYLQKPISDIIGDVEARKDPDAPRRLAASAAPVIWDWIDQQIPELVKKLDVQSMVERKVMAFSVERVEEILLMVIEKELRMIIIAGYVLGALVGAVSYVGQKLLGL